MLIFVLVRPGLAQNQDTAAALVLGCDWAAASPTDKNRPVGLAGVPSGRLDSQIAIAACEAAAAAAPDNPRIMFQLGRAHAAAKADESARAYFSKASDLGYAAARASLGSFYAIGRGGVARNDDEALRLSKLAAEQGDPLGNNNLGFFYETGVAACQRTIAKPRGTISLPPTMASLGGNTISAASIRTVAAD